MRYYVDTSAAGKLLADETESDALAQFLDEIAERGDTLVSCLLLETELRRMATRWSLSQRSVSELLLRFELLLPDRTVYREAGLLAGTRTRSLDALHVTSALRLDAAALITYDARQSDAAETLGLHVITPS